MTPPKPTDATSGSVETEGPQPGSPELEAPEESWVEGLDEAALEELEGFAVDPFDEIEEAWLDEFDEAMEEGVGAPAFQAFVLSSPCVRNENVRRAQQLINEESAEVGGPEGILCPEKLLEDGEYGPVTAHAVRAWKFRSGCPNASPRMSRWEFIGLLRTAEKGVELGALTVTKKDGSTTNWAEISAARKEAQKGHWRKGRGISPFAWDEAHKPDGDAKRKAVDIMLGWYKQGLKESPPGSNRVPELEALAGKVDGAVYRSPMGWPWCQFGACLAHAMAGGTAGAKGLANKWNGLYTVDAVTRAKLGQFGMRLKPRSRAEKGDWLMMNFPGGSSVCDHIAVAAEDYSGPDSIRTVEGNTSYGSSGAQANGGAVAARVRPMSQISYVIDPGD